MRTTLISDVHVVKTFYNNSLTCNVSFIKRTHIQTKTHKILVLIKFASLYVMFCTIWYHLNNVKNVKNTHGGVLLLPKITLRHGCFSCFSNCKNGPELRKTLNMLTFQMVLLFLVVSQIIKINDLNTYELTV